MNLLLKRLFIIQNIRSTKKPIKFEYPAFYVFGLTFYIFNLRFWLLILILTYTMDCLSNSFDFDILLIVWLPFLHTSGFFRLWFYFFLYEIRYTLWAAILGCPTRVPTGVRLILHGLRPLHCDWELINMLLAWGRSARSAALPITGKEKFYCIDLSEKMATQPFWL